MLNKEEMVKALTLTEEEYAVWKTSHPLPEVLYKFLDAQKRMWDSQAKMFEAVKEAIKVKSL